MSDLHLVAMPKWGLSMEEGLVVAWHRQVGDAVASGDDLIDVETTKITNTVEAPVTGILRRILADPGTTASCGAPLAVLGAADIAESEVDRFVAEQGTRAIEAAGDGPAAASEPVTATVASDGESTRIRYLETGSGEETLVLIHGFGGDLENWMFNQPALAAGRRVIAIDLPGHGGSDKRVGDGSAATLAGTIIALLDDIAPGRLHLVAHSFGAMVAREIAVADPRRVATFIAIAPADLGKIDRAYIDGFIGARRRSDLTSALALLFADPAIVTREMAEALLRYKRLDGVEQALRAIDAASLQRPEPDAAATALWRGLGARGLLIWGAQDAVIPLSSAQTDFPDVAARVIEGAGHMPHIERAEQVNAAITEHLARCREQATGNSLSPSEGA